MQYTYYFHISKFESQIVHLKISSIPIIPIMIIGIDSRIYEVFTLYQSLIGSINLSTILPFTISAGRSDEKIITQLNINFCGK